MFVKKEIVDFLSFSPHKLFNEQKQLANSRAPFFLFAKNELCRRFIEFYFEYDIVDCRLCWGQQQKKIIRRAWIHEYLYAAYTNKRFIYLLPLRW